MHNFDSNIIIGRVEELKNHLLPLFFSCLLSLKLVTSFSFIFKKHALDSLKLFLSMKWVSGLFENESQAYSKNLIHNSKLKIKY